MEERIVADVVCPLCGLPIEVAQQFVRPTDDQEYMTVRCMADHYLTIKVDDLDLLVVGQPDATVIPFDIVKDEEAEPGLD